MIRIKKDDNVSSLYRQFKKIQNMNHGLITTVSNGKIWEISLPKVLRTEFTQTNFILEKRPPFYYLHDNGSCNNGLVFHLNFYDQRIRSTMMIRYHVRRVGHQYYEIRFLRNQSNGVIKNVQNLTQFFLKLDQLFRKKI